MKRFMAVLLAVLMLLSLAACGGDSAETTTAAPTTTAEPTTEATTVPETEEPTVEETTVPETEPPTEPEPTEPEGISNPLNGTKSEDAVYDRPYAVAINNIKAAQPLCGVGQADVMIEALTEGGITRFLAVFSDLGSVEHVGSVRSARPVFIDLAQAFKAIYVHAGGSQQAYTQLSNSGYDHLDGLRGASSVFYRDSARLSAGYSREHTLFTEGDDIVALAAKKGITTTLSEPLDYGYQFTIYDAIEEGSAATSVSVQFRKNGKLTTFAYDEALGSYRASQYSKEMTDGNTGEAVTFENLLVLEVSTTSDGKYVFMDLTGHGSGWFASGGKMIPIQWSRDSNKVPFTFTTASGEPITFKTGHTYIGLVPTGSPVSFA